MQHDNTALNQAESRAFGLQPCGPHCARLKGDPPPPLSLPEEMAQFKKAVVSFFIDGKKGGRNGHFLPVVANPFLVLSLFGKNKTEISELNWALSKKFTVANSFEAPFLPLVVTYTTSIVNLPVFFLEVGFLSLRVS